MTRHEKAWATRRARYGEMGFSRTDGFARPNQRPFHNPEKAWATRRAKYGPNGGREAAPRLTWIPAEKRGRYDSLRNMHGAEMAKEILKLELGDASSTRS